MRETETEELLCKTRQTHETINTCGCLATHVMSLLFDLDLSSFLSVYVRRLTSVSILDCFKMRKHRLLPFMYRPTLQKNINIFTRLIWY